jgi:hypothetical protein
MQLMKYGRDWAVAKENAGLFGLCGRLEAYFFVESRLGGDVGKEVSKLFHKVDSTVRAFFTLFQEKCNGSVYPRLVSYGLS